MIAVWVVFRIWPVKNTSDVAAWVQAVGSILAIMAAIFIDQGAARRLNQQQDATRKAALAEHHQTILDWRRAAKDGLELVENISRMAPVDVHTDSIDKDGWFRSTLNMVGALDVYLKTPPPNPAVGWLVVAIRNDVDLLHRWIAAFNRETPRAAWMLHAHAAEIAANAREAFDQYEAGLL